MVFQSGIGEIFFLICDLNKEEEAAHVSHYVASCSMNLPGDGGRRCRAAGDQRRAPESNTHHTLDHLW